MIVPSIDLMDGNAVQLVGGKNKAIDAGDPRPIAERFARAGEVAVVDLDAALGRGSNADVISELIDIAPCRVGGGIRDVDTAIRWLDRGATKVVLGTAAVPEVLRQLPSDRVVAALDADGGEIVVEGWRKRTGHGVIERMKVLEGLAGGFLVTFVEREGRMGGTNMDQVGALVRAAGRSRVTVAGGVTTMDEIAAIDEHGADAQIGMALYSGRMDLAAGFAASMRGTAPWPAVVVDEHGVALTLTECDLDSLQAALSTGRHTVAGRDVQIVRADQAESRTSLRLVVRTDDSRGEHARTSWGEDWGLPRLGRRLLARVRDAPAGSYTRRLLDDPDLLRAKLSEEASELADAVEVDHVAEETADVLYFALVAAARAGVPLSAVAERLDRRSLRVSRRPGDAKDRP